MLKTTFDLFLQMCGLSRAEFDQLPEDEQAAIVADFKAMCEIWNTRK